MRPLLLPRHWTHRHHDTVTSTMLCCDPSTVEPGTFLLVTADRQTAGRGQRGTTWESRTGENLTFNIGFRSPASGDGHWPAADEQFLISEAVAVAVALAVQDFLPAELAAAVSVKWPNDVYVGERKICGMLLEHQLAGRRIVSTIAGIGINVNQQRFATVAGEEEGRGAPISIYQLLGHDVEREAVLEGFIRHFVHTTGLLRSGSFDELEALYSALLFRRTGFHRYRDAEGNFRAELADIARSGLLSLRTDSGQLRTYAFKEVVCVM